MIFCTQMKPPKANSYASIFKTPDGLPRSEFVLVPMAFAWGLIIGSVATYLITLAL